MITFLVLIEEAALNYLPYNQNCHNLKMNHFYHSFINLKSLIYHFSFIIYLNGKNT